MHQQNPEFISYQQIKHDPHLLGIAEIRIGKLLARFKQIKSKSGNDFFVPASYVFQRDGEKVFLPVFEHENEYENKQLSTFVRENVYKILKQSEDFKSNEPINF